MNNLISSLIIAVVIAVFILAMPIGLIWSFNTLFDLGIEYTFNSWLAMLILMGAIMAGGSR